MPYMEGRAPEGEARAARSGSEVTSTSGARAWGVEDTATRYARLAPPPLPVLTARPAFGCTPAPCDVIAHCTRSEGLERRCSKGAAVVYCDR
jgi:hypothetical protein